MDEAVMKCYMVLPTVTEGGADMTKHPYTVAGFIVPYKCYKTRKQESCEYLRAQ